MKTALVVCALVIICGAPAAVLAQQGTAGPGFYPFGYHGDIWTGEVTAADDDKRELTLTYKRGDKVQTFVAFVPDSGVGWMKDETGERVLAIWPVEEKKKNDKPKSDPLHLNLADFVGRNVTVYYINREKKVDNQKVKFNEVIRIKINSKK